MPSDDRDQKFERALAQHLRGGPAQAHCPDAEILAAYHERNLSLEEMARWKQHISTCSACQEALAQVETTENQLVEEWKDQEVPVQEAVSLLAAGEERSLRGLPKATPAAAPQAASGPVPIRRRPALLRWAVPLGAVAAGVLVFIGFYEQRTAKVAPYSDTITARREEPAAPGAPLDQTQNKVQPQMESKDAWAATGEMSTQKKEQELRAMPAAKPAERTRAGDHALAESGGQTVGTLLEKKAQTPPPPPPSADILAQADRDAAVSANAPAIAAAPRPAPPPATMAYGSGTGGAAGGVPARTDAKSVPPAASQTVTVESAPPQIDATSSIMMKQGVKSRNVTSLSALASGTGFILSPDNKVWWKLGPEGTVDLTTDGGKKWKSLDTGVTTQLTAGAAPSSKVCWIAGKAGALVLTTDRGAHWVRISIPVTGDLGGVHATDAKHASIWDAAKQISYETSDGGATWKQTSGK